MVADTNKLTSGGGFFVTLSAVAVNLLLKQHVLRQLKIHTNNLSTAGSNRTNMFLLSRY